MECGFDCFVFSSRRRHTRCALVTGVQTCALPISRLAPSEATWSAALVPSSSGASEKLALLIGGATLPRLSASTVTPGWTLPNTASPPPRPSGPSTWSAPSATALSYAAIAPPLPFGRASCRERLWNYVWISVVSATLYHTTNHIYIFLIPLQ